MTRIAHLSDTHFDGGPARAKRLRRVLDAVHDLADIDAIVVTGDIADHGEVAEYQQFSELMETELPTLVVPGNHDRRQDMAHFMTPTQQERFDSVQTVGDVTIIGLDSLIEGEDAGYLNAVTVEFANEATAASPGPVVLALHHPPVAIGHSVMDGLGLRNADDLRDLIEANDSVIGMFTGHVHCAVATTFAGRPMLGAPGIVSTMHLVEQPDQIADDSALPGLAVHTIDPSQRITTRFHTLSPEEDPAHKVGL